MGRNRKRKQLKNKLSPNRVQRRAWDRGESAKNERKYQINGERTLRQKNMNTFYRSKICF